MRPSSWRQNPDNIRWAPGSSQTWSPGLLSHVSRYTHFVFRMLCVLIGHLHLKELWLVIGASKPWDPLQLLSNWWYRGSVSKQVTPGKAQAQGKYYRKGRTSLPVLVWPWSQVLQQKTLWKKETPWDASALWLPLFSPPDFPSFPSSQGRMCSACSFSIASSPSG